MVVANEINGADADLGAFPHLKSDRGETCAPIAVQAESHLGLVEAIFLIKFVDLLRIVLDLTFIQRPVSHGLDLFL